MAKRQSLTTAHPKPCAHCPWRVENQGKRHKHGFYTKANLRRLWSGLKNGERMTCHPTDPEMAEFEGYEKTADREVTYECAGALILVQREVMRFQSQYTDTIDPTPEATKAALKAYREKHPKGLTKVGLFRHMMAVAFDGNPMTGPRAATPDLNTEGIGHPDLVPWTVGETHG